MDFPYLAILWNPATPASAHAAELLVNAAYLKAWRTALSVPGIGIYTRNPTTQLLRPLRLNADSGIILGALFKRATNRIATQSNIDTEFPIGIGSTEIISRLTSEYWGGYIAVVNDRNSGNHHVVRDCSGIIPCYYTALGPITLVASDARLFFALTRTNPQQHIAKTPTINWTYITAFLIDSQLQIRETGLTDVYELLAGETLSTRDGRFTLQLTWNPAKFVDRRTDRTIQETAESLFNVAQASIDAWASTHDWLIHSLSGGFDSSLVLALLKRSPSRPNVVCITRYSDGPAEDERQYARVAARMAGAPLIEWPWNFGNSTLDSSCLALPFGAKPSISTLFGSLETTFLPALRRAHRFDSIWTGEGGDHLFLAITTTLIVIDFLRDRGIKSGLLDVLRDTFRLTGHAIPQLIGISIRHALSRTTGNSGKRNSRESPYLRSCIDPIELHKYCRNPWDLASQCAPPGKHLQISLLAEAIHRNRPLAKLQGAVELSPLLCQPLIEECLTIPTYLLLMGGRKRGLARHAFSNIVPIPIVNREMKGQTTHHGLGLLDRSLTFIRETLLDGELTHRAITNPAALAPVLSGSIPISDSTFFPLLACLTAEVWIRSWSGIDNFDTSSF